MFPYPALNQEFTKLLIATKSASISKYSLEHQFCNRGWRAAGSVVRKLQQVSGKLRQSNKPAGPGKRDVPWRPKVALGRNLAKEREHRNISPSNHPASRLKTWKVDFLYVPSRKLLGAFAAALTEHVQAALRMLCRGPVRFLLRDQRCLLTQPELSGAGLASLILGGLVVSDPPRPSSPLHPLGLFVFSRKQPS